MKKMFLVIALPILLVAGGGGKEKAAGPTNDELRRRMLDEKAAPGNRKAALQLLEQRGETVDNAAALRATIAAATKAKREALLNK